MNKTITTPAGIARYPHLNRPDKMYVAEGVFTVRLEMSDEDAEPFIKQVEAIFSDFVADKKKELKKNTLKMHAAPWEQNDGMTQFKLKVRAIGKSKDGEEYSRAPKLFNASGEIITDNIGGGSKIKAAVIPYCWYTATLGAGITLQPKAIQVLDLVTWSSGGTAEAYGFETEAEKRQVEIEAGLAAAKVYAVHRHRDTLHEESRKTGTDDEEISW